MIDIKELLAAREESIFTRFNRGDLATHLFLRPCRTRILMVVDGYPGSFLNVSFSHSYFGLSAVLDTLRDNPEFFVRFDVTRAHRQMDSFKPAPSSPDFAKYGPHFENFRFTQLGFDLDNYDQVWLFGARSGEAESQRLSDAELDVLARWMDKGGSVFATGDHADLGASLCARIPRVRSMRKWTFGQGVPNPTGVDRHDTNVKGSDPTITFDDESDDIPMKLTVKKYSLPPVSYFQKRSAPHPVLCGTEGVIDILPDHPHEGEIIEESLIDTTRKYTYATYADQPEYPSASGTQPKPEVIAWAHVSSEHTAVSDTNKGECKAKSFGAIGVYDGEPVGAGRLVVDSTWHHWFDVNVTGRPVPNLDSPPFNSTNPKVLGFLATMAGQEAWSRIQNYYRNVALWLAPKAQRQCMYNRAVWGVIIRYPLVERIRAMAPIWELGLSARDALGRQAGQCTIRDWIRFDLPVLVDRLWPKLPPPDPCLTCPPIDLLEIYALGGAVRELLKIAYAAEESGRLDDVQLDLVRRRGVMSGLHELRADLEKSFSKTDALVRSFASALRRLEKPQGEMVGKRVPRNRKRRSK